MTNNISLLKTFLAVSVAANLLFVAMLITSWGASSDEERSASVAMSGEKLDVNVKAEAVAEAVAAAAAAADAPVLTRAERVRLEAAEFGETLRRSGYTTMNPDLRRLALDRDRWAEGKNPMRFIFDTECHHDLNRSAATGNFNLRCSSEKYSYSDVILAFPSNEEPRNRERIGEMTDWWLSMSRGKSHAPIRVLATYDWHFLDGRHLLNLEAIIAHEAGRQKLIGASPSLNYPTRCGAPLATVPSDVDRTAWLEFACVSPEEAESREQCFARADYADEAGRGCPGRSLCCSPKPKEEGL